MKVFMSSELGKLEEAAEKMTYQQPFPKTTKCCEYGKSS